ncbi:MULTISPECIES: cation acetate symporter [unclassified Pseudofrankia]|uniref:sodium:solute symporter family transporter n=1 Tax=unclassified Pseudofrankia TaxID=2994372 RepID=UPI0009F6DEB2
MVCVATLAVGALGLRLSRTTSDFYVASRVVSPRWNASAIGGEYLSAASFLGVAGLVLAAGADMLWYPIGYTAGYVVLLVLVAAPLRRSGAFTLPDFAEIRMGSARLRRVASVLVVGIGWLYLLPQFQGAGLALRAATGAPAWLGAVIVAGVVVLNVLAGGMRSITIVQAFQYWLKLTAIAVPVFFLLAVWWRDGAPAAPADGHPVTVRPVTVRLVDTVRVRVDTPTTFTMYGVLNGHPVAGPVRLAPDGVRDGSGPAGTSAEADATVRASGGAGRLPAQAGETVRLGTAGTAVLSAGSTVTLPAGTPVPRAEAILSRGGTGAVPAGAARRDHALYRTYSLLVALLLGTMGLPHVIVRFYTNPDGGGARRTAAAVIGLLGAFYLFPPVYAALGRVYAPDLLLTGRTDTVVLALPARVLPGAAGEALAALVMGGAFAAFLSTSSGLTVSVAGVLSQDLLRRRTRTGVAGFRAGAVLAVAVPAAGTLLATRVGLADTVGLAFAVAASTFCPLLVLGIWWRRLSVAGALCGLGIGGLTATSAAMVTMLGWAPAGLAGALLAQPAAWTVPLSFAVMLLVSLRTPATVPAGVGRVLTRLHVPEAVRAARAAPPDSTPAFGLSSPAVQHDQSDAARHP